MRKRYILKIYLRNENKRAFVGLLIFRFHFVQIVGFVHFETLVFELNFFDSKHYFLTSFNSFSSIFSLCMLSDLYVPL